MQNVFTLVASEMSVKGAKEKNCLSTKGGCGGTSAVDSGALECGERRHRSASAEFLVNFFARQEKRDLRGDYHVRSQRKRINQNATPTEIKLFGPARRHPRTSLFVLAFRARREWCALHYNRAPSRTNLLFICVGMWPSLMEGGWLLVGEKLAGDEMDLSEGFLRAPCGFADPRAPKVYTRRRPCCRS